MEFATGALGTLLPKLAQLLQGEYKMHKNMRKNIEFLKRELEFTHAALRNVGEVPPEQLNELVRLWAQDARELSYDMEDIIDTFLVRVEGSDTPSKTSPERFIQKMKSMLAIGKRHWIGKQMEVIEERIMEVAARRDRYNVHTINPVTTLDPRITTIYTNATQLVGINEARGELLTKLTKGCDINQQRIVSIVGLGGLGKTTLAKAVYDELKWKFHLTAFVTVSRNPDIKKCLKDMLYELDKQKYGNIQSTSLDVNHLIDLAREFLKEMRYLIIIDDIWDIIKCALPDLSGCIIITTTRNLTVAEHIGGAYKMKALSNDNSRLLMCRRIFGIEDLEKCHHEHLAEVFNKILKKCAGVPLAIITIAGLLATKRRNEMDWYNVYHSIGTGMKNSLDAEKMRKILSYSYYDLPSCLRTCLLYLCAFPEDYQVEKHRLIWLWIAEGFIKSEEKGKRLFELGESYFNELINRSMIQPVYDDFSYEIKYCRIHDMVLDLLCSLSSQENFFTILSDTNHTSASTTVRRLSIQNGKVNHASTRGARSIPQPVRSVVVFSSTIGQMPALQRHKILRVLDLQGCDLSQGYSLNYLGSLHHLRYLNLRSTRVAQLPEEIWNLQFLETLNLSDTNIYSLSLGVAQPKHLLCLLVNCITRLPNGIGSLRSLEELSWLCIDNESTESIEELGLLTELKVLRITLFTNQWNDKLLESLYKLQKIQKLSIMNLFHGQRNIGGLDGWIAPRHLRSLETQEACWFSRLPTWMNNPSHLVDLSSLCIAVRELQQQDLEILGRLPALRRLNLEVGRKDHRILGRFMVHAGSFPCLVCYELWGFVGPVVFQKGAMPSLTKLGFNFYVGAARGIAGSDCDFDLGLRNLPSLQEIRVRFLSGGACVKEVGEAEAAVEKAAEIHPNQPELWIEWC